MASIKVKFRHSSIAGKEGSIYYQIIHQRHVLQVNANYRILSEEWDEKRSMIICRTGSDRYDQLSSTREKIRLDIERLSKIIRELDLRGISYTAEDIVDNFEHYSREYSLFNYMLTQISTLKQRGKVRTAETYKAAFNSLRKFCNDDCIMLDAITSEMMEAYESSLQANGNTPNTTSFYMRILRAVYNRAVENEIIENRHPFRHVYTGVEKTTKRALPIHIMKKIRSLDLSRYPQTDYARDMFLMSFFLRGMSFIDMAFLRKTDLNHGYISYRRHKTGQALKIKWTKDMQHLLEKYPENPTDYLLPILTKTGIDERRAYRNISYNINHQLKKIAELVKADIPLTLYVARHSWASAAKAKGIPLSVISEGMGHDSETTTQIYLASLDTSVIDKANPIILKSL